MMGSATYYGKSHLDFKVQPKIKSRKTRIYSVINKRFCEKIGIIYWNGAWRQFVFEAQPCIAMSRSCMKEVISFIDKLMVQWRKGRK